MDRLHGAEPVVPAGWTPDPDLPIVGWTDVELSLHDLWDTFVDVQRWPAWNPSIRWAHLSGRTLRVGARLTWLFGPIRPWLPYRLPATARIVEVVPERRVTWEVSLPGFHALHSYLFDDGGHSGSSFGSWEIAEGALYRATRWFWLAHFRYVCRRSLAGAAQLGTRTVRLVEHGPGTAPAGDVPPVVVIPGIDGLPGSVAPIVEALARNRRVLLVDYSAEIEPSLEALGLAIAARLPERCDVVGQSIGTWLAAEVARLRPEAVRRVVLIATFTRTRAIAVRLSAAFTRITPRPVYRRTTPALMRLTCGPVGDGGDHPFLDGVANSEQEGVARRTRWQVGRDASALLRAITQPVAVFLGGSDRFVPNRRREFARIASIFSRPGDRVTVIAGAGHVLLPSAAVAEAIAGIEDFLA